MSNAALYLHSDAYDTTGSRLMGRHAAGESFLRGFLRHADVEKFYFYNGTAGPQQGLAALVNRIQPPTKPSQWLAMRNLRGLGEPGCLYYPAPDLPTFAWSRLPFGSHLYSLCGVTHTTASQGTMDIVANMFTAPVQPWDGLITTSSAVRASVEREMEAVKDDLAGRLGATKFPLPQLTTIPLGVNADDFATSPEHRRAWRERLDIPQDAIVALYVGRLHMAAKMNPALMAMALEEAARRTGKEIYWVVSGWGATEAYDAKHHALTQELCPSIHYRVVDGRPADTRFSIWSVADFFISFSDNIQETFGLTPVEAMAAGLPSVVTDWDGYRDTVRHGIDGFRIRTIAPRPGLGRDLAYQHANGWMAYELYLVSAAQLTAMDNQAAADAIVALVDDPGLRKRMGAAAYERARTVFDWSAVVPQYQAFWAELAARRRAAAASIEVNASIIDNPRRLDPFTLFESYPSDVLTPKALVRVPSGMTWEVALGRLSGGLATIGNWPHPNLQEMAAAFEFFQSRPQSSVEALLAQFPAGRHSLIERGLLWLAKFDVLHIEPTSGVDRSLDA